MSRLIIVRNPENNALAVMDSETGISEPIELPDSQNDAASVLEFGPVSIPEGIDISSRYHYLVN